MIQIPQTHRHEPPVVSTEPVIVFEDDDFMVVDKPASIPVHPCGAYRFNSLEYILKSMRPEMPVTRFVHRLDRLTSGLIIMVKRAELASSISKLLGTSSLPHHA